DVKQQLHEVMVGGKDGRLDDISILAADILEQAHERVALGEFDGLVAAGVDPQFLANPRCEFSTAVPAEDQHFVHVRPAFIRSVLLPGMSLPPDTLVEKTFDRFSEAKSGILVAESTPDRASLRPGY